MRAGTLPNLQPVIATSADHAKQPRHQQHDQDQAKETGAAITPTAVVAPGGYGADDWLDQDDEHDGQQDGTSFSVLSTIGEVLKRSPKQCSVMSGSLFQRLALFRGVPQTETGNESLPALILQYLPGAARF